VAVVEAAVAGVGTGDTVAACCVSVGGVLLAGVGAVAVTEREEASQRDDEASEVLEVMERVGAVAARRNEELSDTRPWMMDFPLRELSLDIEGFVATCVFRFFRAEAPP